MKLNQVIALVGGRKAEAQKLLTAVHHGWQDTRLSGLVRTYQPIDDEGEKLPGESRHVQLDAESVLDAAMGYLADFYDLVAIQETANTEARANVVVEGVTLLENVPVSVLLFLEKQLVDLRTLAQNLPILAPDAIWHRDQNKGCWATDPQESVRTRKELRVLVKYEATKEHPAQTETYSTDVPVGRWTTVHLSGAVPAERQNQILKRIKLLSDAVKLAREEANSIEAQSVYIGEQVLSFVFGK